MIITGRQTANFSIILQEFVNDKIYLDRFDDGTIYFYQVNNTHRNIAYLHPDGEIEWVAKGEKENVT